MHNNTSTYYFIAPLPALAKRTRLAKMADHFTGRGIQIDFAGWERLPDELKTLRSTNSLVRERTILRGGGYSSRKARMMYPVWMICVFFYVIRLGFRRNVFCLGWETAFPALIASIVTRSKIIFDDADRFSLIVRLPGVLHRLLQFLERWASRRALVHIVPSFSRYEWKHDRMMPLRNTPLSHEFEEARSRTPSRIDADFVIYANGWLGETRGAPIFLELANRLQNCPKNVRMLIAGRVDSPAGQQLIAHPRVNYLGEVNQTQALSYYPVSDIVLTYYDPRVEINRKAESNKWGDCVFFGVRFIVNAEVETAATFIAAGAAIAVLYHDVDALYQQILSLASDTTQLDSLRSKLLPFRKDYPVFDQQLDQLITYLS